MAEGEEKEERGYFGLDTPYAGPAMGDVFWGLDDEHSNEGVKLKFRRPTRTPRRSLPRKAGDLVMSSVNEKEVFDGSFAPSLVTPRIERGSGAPAPAEDFDLRDSVMECISKAIGLVQGAATPSVSVEQSPMFRPLDSNLQHKAMFNSSFGSLSLLGLQGFDDESSMTGSSASAASFSSTDLENEVEVRYFPKGSTLVKEGERNAGLYYIIEGFLDVSMPEPASDPTIQNPKAKPTTNIPSTHATKARASSSQLSKTSSRQSGGARTGSPRPPLQSSIPRATQANFDKFNPSLPPLSPDTAEKDAGKKSSSVPLFTVKPGGIAGYLSSLSGFPSYVDITAKTDCYVGFLPAKALERIMDRKPIVLLTLAKRLISLLSPLSESPATVVNSTSVLILGKLSPPYRFCSRLAARQCWTSHLPRRRPGRFILHCKRS